MFSSKEINSIIEMVRPYTMVPNESLLDLAWQVLGVLETNVPGDFVECGVWRGGAGFLIAEILRQADIRDRKVWLFDSFEGMPPPDAIDGTAARAWATRSAAGREELIMHSPHASIASDQYIGALEKVQEVARLLGFSSNIEFVKGWFEATLPANGDRIGQIALLRIDCDWYASVLKCLEALYDKVSDNGVVILDDYYTYEGCALAVHEFLGLRHLPHPIETVYSDIGDQPESISARFFKGGLPWSWRYQFLQTALELRRYVMPGDLIILADQEQFREGLVRHNILPFLENDGLYWGPPKDGSIAISELHRLRDTGARYFVLARPCFWWLDCYPDFISHLRTRFRSIAANAHVLIFDLQLEGTTSAAKAG